MLDAEGPQILDGGAGTAAQLIEEQQPAEKVLAAAHACDRPIVLGRRRRHDADALEQVGAAQSDGVTEILTGHAEATELAGVLQRKPLFLRQRRRGRTAQWMVARRTQACAELPQQAGIGVRDRPYLGKPQIPRGHRAGLVEDHCRDIGQMLQERGALDEDSMACGDRDGGDCRGWSCKHERARARGHEHGQHRRHVPCDQPNACGNEQHKCHVLAGIAVEQSGHGRLGVLRIPHEADDAPEGALLADARQLHLEQAVNVHRPSQHLVPLANLDGD